MTYIHHITLTTGHVRRSTRDEVADDVVAQLQAHVLEGGPVPGFPDYHLEAEPRGKCWQGVVFAGDLALVTIGVATRAQCGARLWRRLHEPGLTLATRPDQRPPEPWCGVVLHPGLATRTDAATWLGDYERCLAWAWVEHLAH